MYPNQQLPNQPQYPVDYLNQIAPTGPKNTGFGRKQLALVAGAIILLFIGTILLILHNIGPSTNHVSQQLAARLQSTETIVGDAQGNIKSSELRTLNSSLKLFLTNANRDITEPLRTNNINTEKLDKAIVATESGEKLAATLEDARLNATFDRTYAREMSYQLEMIMALMQEIDAKTNSNSLKEFLDNAYTNLKPLQTQMAEFNATNS